MIIFKKRLDFVWNLVYNMLSKFKKRRITYVQIKNSRTFDRYH